MNPFARGVGSFYAVQDTDGSIEVFVRDYGHTRKVACLNAAQEPIEVVDAAQYAVFVSRGAMSSLTERVL